jgi:hypothetical protein
MNVESMMDQRWIKDGSKMDGWMDGESSMDE